MTKSSKHIPNRPTVQGVTENALPVVFTTLIIRVGAIKKYWVGGVEGYVKGPAWGRINAHIAAMAEMMAPGQALEQFIEKELLPRGFEQGKDFVIGEEQLMAGVQGRENRESQELPWCIGVPWLRSFSTTKGWFVEGL